MLRGFDDKVIDTCGRYARAYACTDSVAPRLEFEVSKLPCITYV